MKTNYILQHKTSGQFAKTIRENDDNSFTVVEWTHSPTEAWTTTDRRFDAEIDGTRSVSRMEVKAHIYDYKSGVRVGTTAIDWNAYRAWAEGASQVCEARRILSPAQVEALGIAPDTTVFAFEAED